MQAYKCDDCGILLPGAAPTAGGGKPRARSVAIQMENFQVAMLDTLVVDVRVTRSPGSNGGECLPVDLCEYCRADAVIKAGLALALEAGAPEEEVATINSAARIMRERRTSRAGEGGDVG